MIMKAIKLNKDYELKFYNSNKRLHTKVFKNGKPFHCRKESVSTIKKLISGASKKVGKISLILKNQGEYISLHYKDELLGKVRNNVFTKSIALLKEGKLEQEEC